MPKLRLLLVDDEKALLLLLKRHLERSGFDVVGALSAELALDAVASSSDNGSWIPDVLVTDKALPGLSGTDLAAALAHRFPELVCLICSGFVLSPEDLPLALRDRAAILQKPYLPEMIDQAVAALLATASRRITY